MKKFLVLGVVLFMFTVHAAHAGPEVKCDIEKVREHRLLVTFMWKVSVVSDKSWDACDLNISFRDNKGLEIHKVHEPLKLKVGTNAFTGTEICETEAWKRMTTFHAILDCVF